MQIIGSGFLLTAFLFLVENLQVRLSSLFGFRGWIFYKGKGVDSMHFFGIIDDELFDRFIGRTVAFASVDVLFPQCCVGLT